jgi:hypothetical protein
VVPDQTPVGGLADLVGAELVRLGERHAGARDDHDSGSARGDEW